MDKGRFLFSEMPSGEQSSAVYKTMAMQAYIKKLVIGSINF